MPNYLVQCESHFNSVLEMGQVLVLELMSPLIITPQSPYNIQIWSTLSV